MALVHETPVLETEYGSKVMLTITEREKNEMTEPWRNTFIETNGFDTFTHKELIEIGRWFVKQGQRIGKEYTSKGRPRTKK